MQIGATGRGSRSVAFYLRDRVSKCKSNRPVAQRNYDSHVETVVVFSSRTRTIVLHPGRRGKREDRERERERVRTRGGGREEGEGEREEVNQFESPGSDPAARERSAGQIAPYSFGYGPIRYTGRKAPESHVRAEWRQPAGFLAPGFPGVSTDRKNVYGFARRLPFAKRERRRRRRRRYRHGGEANARAAR